MDRIDAMKVFVAVVDANSLTGASHKLGRSPAAVSRALAFLEKHVGTQLLHRTTRSIRLSESGARYAAACRRMLADLEEADMLVAGERSAPCGMLTVTAPVAVGEDVLRPVLDAFMDAYPNVSVRLDLLDRPANLIDGGSDVALRISHLADSRLVAIRLGEVRRVVAASPRYLATRPRIAEPADLAKHQIIAMTHFGIESWSFAASEGSARPRMVHFTPRLIVNSVRGAIASAVEGCGVTRLFANHIAEEVLAADLKLLLTQDEHPPYPVHLMTPARSPVRAEGPRVHRLCRSPATCAICSAQRRMEPNRACSAGIPTSRRSSSSG
ncbi:MAG: LysR family transcriptional regulator [Aliidongia sp.]